MGKEAKILFGVSDKTIITILKYAVAVVVAGGAVYFINAAYNQPQPYVSIMFNYSGQKAYGYINNTLPYNINLTYIYCTVPGNGRYKFVNPPADSTVDSGKNISISLSAGANVVIPMNCTHWGVAYVQTSSSANATRVLITITPTNSLENNVVQINQT